MVKDRRGRRGQNEAKCVFEPMWDVLVQLRETASLPQVDD